MTGAQSGTPTTPTRPFRSRQAERVLRGLGVQPGAFLLLVGWDEALVEDLRAAAGAAGQVDVVTAIRPPGSLSPQEGGAPGLVIPPAADRALPYASEQVAGAVWIDSLAALGERVAVQALREVYRVLRTKARIVVIQPTVPKSAAVRLVTSPWYAISGERWTTRDIHGMLERASFWECGLIGRSGLGGVSMMQGEKFSLRDAPDEIWTESQIVRALRVVGGGPRPRSGDEPK